MPDTETPHPPPPENPLPSAITQTVTESLTSKGEIVEG
jgi:hypothetical protein